MVMTMSIRTYSELITIPTFEERFKYLQLNGNVGKETFGFDRVFNQKFYTSAEWRHIRNHVILRDMGCDLAMPGYEIYERRNIFIHHMNPIELKDIADRTEILLNPEFLIVTSFETHNAIHYGTEELLAKPLVVRTKNDTCPWKQ